MAKHFPESLQGLLIGARVRAQNDRNVLGADFVDRTCNEKHHKYLDEQQFHSKRPGPESIAPNGFGSTRFTPDHEVRRRKGNAIGQLRSPAIGARVCRRIPVERLEPISTTPYRWWTFRYYGWLASHHTLCQFRVSLK